MPNEFRAPEGWEGYVNSVIEKTSLLISLGIWEGIDELNLNRWLQNFQTDREKYLGACMLDAFTYRSPKMCHSMMRNILMDLVPNYCKRNSIIDIQSIQHWRNLVDSGVQAVRFVPVNINDGKIKSSAVVAREFIHANDIPQHFIQQPSVLGRAIDNGTKLVVFIDDFAGSGFQFLKFLRQNPIDNYQDKAKFLYAPLCAHQDAIDRIEKETGQVRVIPIDTLTDQHNFFYSCEEGFFRGDKTNSPENARSFYEELFTQCSNKKYLFGMNNQSLTYSFFFSTPNNNIKALYHNELNVWKRLIFRGKS
ncbi:hypothetical protein [Marinobacter sp.]|uniref:phosphoribosyltransferase-like protein n=1 Tax=Marinobacter sp. TaxID=50741 RepID=UPI001B6F984A|nr:hypothetical protein [Marinobacter sp.]MBQ0832839.1 hypothetical protein [Marinobacter sp.]